MTERDVMEYFHTLSDLLGQLESRRADIAVRHGIETAPLRRGALAADLTALDEQIAHEKDWLRRAGARFDGSVQISSLPETRRILVRIEIRLH